MVAPRGIDTALKRTPTMRAPRSRSRPLRLTAAPVCSASSELAATVMLPVRGPSSQLHAQVKPLSSIGEYGGDANVHPPTASMMSGGVKTARLSQRRPREANRFISILQMWTALLVPSAVVGAPSRMEGCYVSGSGSYREEGRGSASA